MIKDLFKNYIYPTATLSGSIIGVGFLSLPYIASKAGVWLTLIYLFALTAITVLINIIVGEIAIKTPDFKRIPGFVGFHLGKWAKAVSLITAILGGFGVLLVFLIIGSDFLSNLFQPLFGGSHIVYAFIFFIAVVLPIYFDIKVISKINFWSILLLFTSLIIIFIKGFSYFKLDNIIFFNQEPFFKIFFLPYGPIIFSLWGVGIIPEVEEMLRGNKKNIKKIIAASVLIPALVYFLFIFLILAITGNQTTESALVGLKNVDSWAAYAGLLAGAIVVFNIFISVGLILKKIFMYDIGIKKNQAIIITCFLPMILFLLGLRFFIPIISFIGGVFIGIDGILILLTYKKIGGKKIISYPLILVFVLGIIYSIIYSIN